MHVNFGPFFQQVVNPVLVAILSGMATAALAYLNSWLVAHRNLISAQYDSHINQDFKVALDHGIAYALQMLDSYEGAHDTVTIKNWLAAKAAQYAVDHSAEYLARFLGDATPAEAIDHAAQKALAILPSVTLVADPNGGKKINTAPVQVFQLPPAKAA